MKYSFQIFTLIFFATSSHAQLRENRQDWNKYYHIITGNNVNVRDTPSKKGDIVAQLNIGHKIHISKITEENLEVKGLEQPFYKIHFYNNGVTSEGYVWAGLVSQFFRYDGKTLYYIKEEYSKTKNVNVSALYELDNKIEKKIGEMELYPTKFIDIRITPVTMLTGINKAIKVRYQDGSKEACEDSHVDYLYIRNQTNDWLKLPRIHSYDAIDGNPVEQFILPDEPFGEKNKIVVGRLRSWINSAGDDLKFWKVKYYTIENNKINETPYNKVR